MKTQRAPRISTFSIVARDPSSGDFGIAVASKFLAVGAVVPGARANVGAVATQSYANLRFVPQGLDLLAAGASPQSVLETFRRTDPDLHTRQFGLVDALGEALTFTGGGCHDWAGGLTANGVAVQGNLLAGEHVVSDMLAAYEQGTGASFPRRLLAALKAGDDAGGDKRGRQSAALLVVGAGKGYGGASDVAVDLRVDDHPDPVTELARLMGVHELLFTRPASTRALTSEDIAWLQGVLQAHGLRTNDANGEWDDETQEGLRALYGTENLEERFVDGPHVDDEAWTYFRSRY